MSTTDNKSEKTQDENDQEIIPPSVGQFLITLPMKSCHLCCIKPLILIIKWTFLPWLQILKLCIPWNLINTITQFLNELSYTPKKIGKFGFRWSIRLLLLFISIFTGISIGVFQYSLFYYMVIPNSYMTE